MSLPIFNFTKIESTNDFARSLITEHKILKGIVIADEQTKGRGRYGNDHTAKNLLSSCCWIIICCDCCILLS